MLTERYDFESFSPDSSLTEAEAYCMKYAINKRIEHQKECTCTKGVNWWLTYPYEIKDEDDNVVRTFNSTVILAYHAEGSRIIIHRTFNDGEVDIVVGLVKVSMVNVDEEGNALPPVDDGSEVVADEEPS